MEPEPERERESDRELSQEEPVFPSVGRLGVESVAGGEGAAWLSPRVPGTAGIQSLAALCWLRLRPWLVE